MGRLMSMQERATWDRLCNLDLDAAEAAMPFSARLARDNGWSKSFAAKAIEEYRKFCFLAVHAGHPVTPSDEVDQVWHLHLLYSRHYWDVLCRDCLGMPLHHGPTEGGAAEGRKYREWYEATLASYRRYFGAPPHDVWPAAAERFHERDEFVRINRRRVVTLDRAALRRGALASIAGGAVLAVARALAQADGATSSGPNTLFWVVVAIVAIVIVVMLAQRRRGPAVRSRDRRASNAAMAAGGAPGRGSDSKGSSDDGASDGGSSDGGAASGCGSGSGCGGGCGGG